jgi:glutaredoxin
MSLIKNFIYPKDKIWTIYTKSNCIYCTQVKELLKSNNIDYITVSCDEYIQNSIEKKVFLSQMENIIGNKYKTFPMVFNEKNFIGGFIDTEKYIESIKKINLNNNLDFNEDF